MEGFFDHVPRRVHCIYSHANRYSEEKFFFFQKKSILRYWTYFHNFGGFHATSASARSASREASETFVAKIVRWRKWTIRESWNKEKRAQIAWCYPITVDRIKKCECVQIIIITLC